MKKLLILVLMLLLSGCAIIDIPKRVPEFTSDSIINVLVNSKEKKIFFVGNKYTYILKKSKYTTMSMIIDILHKSEEFSFQKDSKIKIYQTNMLNGEENLVSGFNFNIKVKLSKKQKEYFEGKYKNFNNDKFSHFIVSNKLSGTFLIRNQKIKSYFNRGSDKEFIVHYHTYKSLYTIKTTNQMRGIASKLKRSIPVEIHMTIKKELTAKEKAELKIQRSSYKMSRGKNFGIVAGMLTAMAIALPLGIIAAPIVGK